MGGMGEKNLHRSITHDLWQEHADGRHKGDDQKAREEQPEIAEHRPDRLFDWNLADETSTVKPEAKWRRKQADAHRDHQYHAVMQRRDAELARHRHQQWPEDD